MFAVISDIHSNFEALSAVFKDIDRRGITEVFCLGDIVGYGASPRETLDLIMDRCAAAICGNHDHATFYEPFNFNVGAERACYWTRRMFEEEPDKAKRDLRWERLGRLQVQHEAHKLLMVHASPRRPVNEYLFAEDVYTNPNKILANFDKLKDNHKACFVGHTHVPGVFLDDPYFEPPGELPDANFYVITEDEKAIINVGSVGQPRDHDTRACYVAVYENGESPLDKEKSASLATADDGYRATVEFIRVEYDVEKAVKKVLAVDELDDFLGTRLLEGR